MTMATRSPQPASSEGELKQAAPAHHIRHVLGPADEVAVEVVAPVNKLPEDSRQKVKANEPNDIRTGLLRTPAESTGNMERVLGLASAIHAHGNIIYNLQINEIIPLLTMLHY